jgi:CxxC motif-containing protein
MLEKDAIYHLSIGSKFRDSAFDEFRNNKNVVLQAVVYDGTAHKYINDELKSDKDIALKAASKRGFSMFEMDEKFVTDYDVAKVAVGKHGHVYEYLNEDLKAQSQIALIAISNSPKMLEFAPNEIKNDKVYLLSALNEEGVSIPSTKQTSLRDIVLYTCQIKKDVLKYAPEELKDDKNIAEISINKFPMSFEYISDRLRNDKELVLTAIKGTKGAALEFASDEIKNNKKIILEAIKLNKNSIDYAHTDIKQLLLNDDNKIGSLEKLILKESLELSMKANQSKPQPKKLKL